MPEKFETIKHAEKPEWWKWEGTWVSKFGCHPDIVDAQIESNRKLYAEQGYEILDSNIEKGSMFARVKLLLRPKRVQIEKGEPKLREGTDLECIYQNNLEITSVLATVNFKLILEFDNREYRLLDMKRFLKRDRGVLKEILDIDLFRTARVDGIARTVVFENGVDFDHDVLFAESVNIDHVLGNEGEVKHEKF
ncbi:DUF2442 domain-containing protein [Lysinibacillus sp. FSL K6-4013]|uniref:DUF2442 domain-containing protein n=1 Tax=Lysinibacillus sp. FSL K6-4013 TaxID=2921504 RepID=UPI00315A5C73